MPQPSQDPLQHHTFHSKVVRATHWENEPQGAMHSAQTEADLCEDSIMLHAPRKQQQRATYFYIYALRPSHTAESMCSNESFIPQNINMEGGSSMKLERQLY